MGRSSLAVDPQSHAMKIESRVVIARDIAAIPPAGLDAFGLPRRFMSYWLRRLTSLYLQSLPPWSLSRTPGRLPAWTAAFDRHGAGRRIRS